MANFHLLGFFVLPTELRNEVYRHLLTDTLLDGRTSDVSAIYLACSTTQAELESMISKVRTLLHFKHECETIESLTGEEVNIKLPRDYLYRTPLAEITLWIPSKVFVIYDAIDIRELLNPVFELPLNTLTLRAYCHLSGCLYTIRDSETVMYMINMVKQKGWVPA